MQGGQTITITARIGMYGTATGTKGVHTHRLDADADANTDEEGEAIEGGAWARTKN